MPPEYQGYHFDEEKGKYFAIQKNHLAPPAAAKYSEQSVEAEKTRSKKRKRDDLHEHHVKTQRIRRARTLEHPLIGGTGLRREIGRDNRNILEDMRRAWVKGLGSSTLFAFAESDIEPKIACFVVDAETGLIHAGMDYVNNGTNSAVLSLKMVGDEGETEYQQAVDSIFDPRHGSFTTSLCLGATTILSSTCAASADQSTLSMVKLPDKTTAEVLWPWLPWGVIEKFTMNDQVVWCAAAAPGPPWLRFASSPSSSSSSSSTSSPSTYPSFSSLLSVSSAPCVLPDTRVEFVFGSTNSIQLVISEGTYETVCESVVNGLRSDVLAVEWLTQTEFVVGLRNGIIALYALTVNSTPTATILPRFRKSQGVLCKGVWRHPTSIVKIVKENEQRILVAGLKNEMAIYDVEDIYAVGEKLFEDDPKPVPRPNERGDLPPITGPLVTFPAYRNRYTRDLGLAVDVELGVVAAATDENRILFFSLYTGELLPCPASEKEYEDPIACIEFQKAPNGSPSVMFCHGRYLEELAW